MFKLICLLGLFLAIDASALKDLSSAKKIGVTIVNSKQLDRLLKENPGLVELKPSFGPKVKSTAGVETREIITYSLASRVNGDRLVAYDYNSLSWPTARDVSLRLDYPTSGNGAVVSYVEIIVNQSTPIGRAYVAAGGIGQRYISIIVEAVATYYFRYDAYIYGY